ncbi:AAA family ATPase [Serratia fonticola]|uniref:AAA family ATPase n=1 Tax=Serratia fonticola TaxID=47917 RepID=UPI001AE7E565|nr:AAA family ATPase [Serratia fonticola]MBP0998012.1 AAA family ATPase [Serratia fonticola]
MKLNIENLGTIKSGVFSTNDLTIIFGKNNSGKTYISYATYILAKKFNEAIKNELSIIDLLKESQDKINSDGVHQIKVQLENLFQKNSIGKVSRITNSILSAGFCVSPDFFKKTKITFDFNSILDTAVKKNLEVSIMHPLGSQVAFIKKEKNSDFLIITFSTNTHSVNDKVDDKTRAFIDKYFCDLITDEIVSNLCDLGISNPFIITSERTGIELFYPELDNNRSSIAEEFLRTSMRNVSTRKNHDMRLLFERNISKYSLPVADNIRAIRNGNLKEINSELSKTKNFKNIKDSLEKMTKGEFIRNEVGNTTFAIKNGKGELEAEIPLQVASSSIKAMSFIDLYINKLAHKDGTLIIDEPELNLHPDNQIIMAELVVRLVNSGIKIIMTTHSDYIIREINNRIKLYTLREKKVKLKEFVDLDIDILSPKRVNVFNIENDGVITNVGTTEHGIETVIFDDVIISTSEREDNINYELGY